PMLSGSDMCSPFDPDQMLDKEHIRTLTGIIEGYESEMATVCATVPECHTDNGRAKHFHVRTSYYNYTDNWDFQHYNVTGLASLANLMCPTSPHILTLH